MQVKEQHDHATIEKKLKHGETKSSGKSCKTILKWKTQCQVSENVIANGVATSDSSVIH